MPLADTTLAWQIKAASLVVREQRVDNVGACVRPPILYHDAPSYELQHLFAYAAFMSQKAPQLHPHAQARQGNERS